MEETDLSLIESIQNGRLDLISDMLEQDADINVQDGYGNTPLIAAILEFTKENKENIVSLDQLYKMIHLLLKYQPDFTVENNDKETAYSLQNSLFLTNHNGSSTNKNFIYSRIKT